MIKGRPKWIRKEYLRWARRWWGSNPSRDVDGCNL